MSRAKRKSKRRIKNKKIIPLNLKSLGNEIEEENDAYSIVSNLSCPNCHSVVEVYYPNEDTIKDYKKHKKKD
jgi:hypothetical protein